MRDGISPALERESGTALAHTALDDPLPGLRLEARTEPVRTSALNLLRLIVSLHGAKIARILAFFKMAGELFHLSTGYKHVDGEIRVLSDTHNKRIMI